jgi:hypothetical protein
LDTTYTTVRYKRNHQKKEKSILPLISNHHLFISGVSCRLLPVCPSAYGAGSLIDIRSGEELVPNLTCRPMPACPVPNQSGSMIDLRTGEEMVPGNKS